MKAVKSIGSRKISKFTVVGGGPREGYFRSLAENIDLDVNFIGRVSIDKVSLELAQADICLVYHTPNKVNTYRSSMKIRECLAMGKKVVCNSFGEFKEFAQYTYQSFYSEKDYASILSELIESGGDGRQNQGAQYLEDNYDWEKIGSDFYRWLHDYVVSNDSDV